MHQEDDAQTCHCWPMERPYQNTSTTSLFLSFICIYIYDIYVQNKYHIYFVKVSNAGIIDRLNLVYIII